MSPAQSAATSLAPDDIPQDLTAKDIDQLLARGAFTEVVQWCGQRIESQPQDFIPYLSLGCLAEIAGDDQRSAEYFAEAIVRNPDCGLAYAHLARVFRKLGQIPHAVRALQVAIEMGAAATDARLDIADMFFEMGDQENASAAYQRVLERRPDCGRSKAMMRLLPQVIPQQSPNWAAPAGWQRAHIAIIAPEGYAHWQAFTATAGAFSQALSELGIACSIGCNEYAKGAQNIIFGAHLIATDAAAADMPDGSIIFNLEQLAGFGADKHARYTDLLRRFTVWDYSPRNIAWLNTRIAGGKALHVPLGFTSNMVSHLPTSEQPTDVLFYGSLNPRRAGVIERLTASGLAVKHLFNVYGDALDAELARAKVVLNMHFYEDSIHEIVRTSYLLANRKAVVTECNQGTEMAAGLRDGMRAVPYDRLADACMDLVNNDEARRRLEADGFALFSRRRQSDLLRAAIDIS